jgi:cellulose synthase/poly-beta-1,6-N-acetylglucosamine synthase-like glycosyltransferase
VPSFNNERTIYSALWSLKNQSLPPCELFQVDDGSVDCSGDITNSLVDAIYQNSSNCGRGAVRAKAMQLAKHDLVLSCDATNYLQIDFVKRAIKWFDDPSVAGVYGQIWQESPNTVSDRWRKRHLFKAKAKQDISYNAILSTYGCILRRSAVLSIGNFDCNLRHSEDADLGKRLLEAGYKVVFDPSLHVISTVSNNAIEVLDRYWRWNAGPDERSDLRQYARNVWYSITVLARRDMEDGDFMAMPISLACPHYQFWKSSWRLLAGKVQR